MDTTIAAFKIASAIIGGILGVVGVFGENRDASGRINRRGRLVIAGLIVSAVIGVLASVVESRKAAADAAEQAARTEQVLKELSRAVQPITEFQLSFWVTLSGDAAPVKSYLARILPAIDAHARRGAKGPSHRTGLRTIVRDDDKVLEVEIDLRSPLGPGGAEAGVATVAGALRFSVYIRRKPIPAETFEAVIPGGADWIASSGPATRRTFSFDLERRRLEIFGQEEYARSAWHSTGSITAITDLYEAQLFLVPPGELTDPELVTKFKPPGTADVMRTIGLRIVALRFGQGREIWLDGAAFKKTRLSSGSPVFSLVLPKDNASLQKLAPRD